MTGARALFASGVAAIAVTSFAASAAAQTEAASQAEPQAAGEAGGLGEIIVTARRREESLQRVPTAVTAVTGDTMIKLGISSAEDLNTAAVGLSVNQASQRQITTFSMRGTTQVSNGGEPGVQPYLDEVPLTRGGFDFFDIGQIEVLRGPQGTLFGRNTTGGAVRVIPVRPSLDAVDGYMDVKVGNFGRNNVEGAINVPFGDKVAVRLSATRIRSEGFVTDTANGQKTNDDHTDAFRGQILFKPTDRFENRVMFSYRDFDTNGSAFWPVNPNVSVDQLLGAAAPLVLAVYPNANQLLTEGYNRGVNTDYREIRSGYGLLGKSKQYILQNVASLELSDDITIKNITGWTRVRAHDRWDLDSTVLPLLEADRRVSEETFTNEFQIQGNALDGRLDWITGVYYEKQSTPDTWVLDIFQFIGTPVGGVNTTNAEYSGNSKAVFAQGSFDLTDQLTATAGLRWTWDKRDGLSSRGAGTPLNVKTNLKSNAPNWTLSVNYQMTPRTMLYAATRRGYKSGNVNVFAVAPNPTSFRPEKLTDIELGLKTTFDTGEVRHRLNVAAYYGWYKDFQRTATVFQGSAGVAAVLYNAGKAETKGIEVEYTAAFADAADLSIQYSYSGVDFKEYVNPFTGGDLSSGTEAYFNPKHKLAVVANVYAPIDEDKGRLYLTGKVAYQSRLYFAEPNAPFYDQDPYTTLDLSLNWDKIMGSAIDASLFAQNVTNKTYFTGGGFDPWADFSRGEPATYGLRVRYRFGAGANR